MHEGFDEFYSFKKFEKSLNATLIALIPKRVRASKVKSYCPISLVNRVYKIISKIPANCMSTVMLKIISKSQNTFLLFFFFCNQVIFLHAGSCTRMLWTKACWVRPWTIGYSNTSPHRRALQVGIMRVIPTFWTSVLAHSKSLGLFAW